MHTVRQNGGRTCSNLTPVRLDFLPGGRCQRPTRFAFLLMSLAPYEVQIIPRKLACSDLRDRSEEDGRRRTKGLPYAFLSLEVTVDIKIHGYRRHRREKGE